MSEDWTIPDSADAPYGLSRVYVISDTETHPVHYLPRRPLKWLLMRYVSTTSTDTCNLGLGGNAIFPLMAGEAPVVVRDFDPDTTDLSFASPSARGILYLLGA